MQKTVDAQEIQNFQRNSSRWWDEKGAFAPLHRLNPVRLAYIRDRIVDHYKLPENALTPLTGLKILDIGCGGGLVCEPLARMGATVTGIDADEQAVAVARKHAEAGGLTITYQSMPAEDLTHRKQTFDVVLALEIVEHVADPDAFAAVCARLCKPGGLVIFSTLNRTPRSFLLGIVAAEHVLRWVPRGTHSWRKFTRPSELARVLKSNKLEPKDIKGLKFNILDNNFVISDKDMDINYFITAIKT